MWRLVICSRSNWSAPVADLDTVRAGITGGSSRASPWLGMTPRRISAPCI
jgi:hypothetical protein